MECEAWGAAFGWRIDMSAQEPRPQRVRGGPYKTEHAAWQAGGEILQSERELASGRAWRFERDMIEAGF